METSSILALYSFLSFLTFLNLTMSLSNVLSQVFIVKSYSKSLLFRKLSLEVEILAEFKYLKIPPYCVCWCGDAHFSLVQAHRMCSRYSALLYCTVFVVLRQHNMSAGLLYENTVWFHSGCPESVRRVSLRSSLFRFLSSKRE